MKNNIAIEITRGGRTTGVVVNMTQVTSMYTVLSTLLHGFDVQIVDIAPMYAKADPRTTLDSIFNMVKDAFGVKISFQVFPLLKNGPRFNTDFNSYETAREMATLWKNQFKTPYGISSKVE